MDFQPLIYKLAINRRKVLTMFIKFKMLLLALAFFLSLLLVKCTKDKSINSIDSIDCSDYQLSLDHYLSNSKIIFISRRTDNSAAWGLYSMNVDGSNQKCLIEKSVSCAYPSRSSNGLMIAFIHYNDNHDYELNIVNIDGGVSKLLATSNRYLGQPSWSPDDSKIVFTGNRNFSSDTTDIHKINIDGSNHAILTHTGDNSCPAWSPDGNLIAFSSSRDGFRGIYLMKPDGSGLELLTGKTSSFTSPQWSPDGQHLVYVSCDFEGSQIFTIDVDGKNQKQLTNTVSPVWYDPGFPRDGNDSPVWSPDGSKLAYRSWQNGNPDIYIMNSDGSLKRQITYSDKRDEMPCWSPLGDFIIFTSRRNMELDFDVFIMNSNGCNQEPLSNYRREDSHPVWTIR
jgi:TolB protein